MITLIRATYGEKDTPKHLREYRINGEGPVGRLDEYETFFPEGEFEIIDTISGD